METWLSYDVCLIEAENWIDAAQSARVLIEKSNISSIVQVSRESSGLMHWTEESPVFRVYEIEAPLSGESFGRAVHRIIQYCLYEGSQSRRTAVWFEDDSGTRAFVRAFSDPSACRLRQRPAVRSETEILCVTMDESETREVLKCGSLAPSAQRSGTSPARLAASNENLFGEPADYFTALPLYKPTEFMDEARLYIKRKGVLPERNLQDSPAIFYPKFYLSYRDISKRYEVRYDGTCVVRVAEPVKLEESLVLLVLPTSLRETLAPFVPEYLEDRVVYLEESVNMTTAGWAFACYEMCTDYLDGRERS